MTTMTCIQARELVAEFALGILPSDERALVAAHIVRCAECRREVDEFAKLGDELLELIPSAEPPLGFDRRVLSATQPHKRRVPKRVLVGVTAVTAAAAAAAVVIGLTLAGFWSGPHELRAPLVSDGRVVGSVYTEGHPPWIWMDVRDGPESGQVSCQLVEADGAVIDLGSFDLVDGNGSWARPQPSGMGHIAAARLVGPRGQVLAQATFKA